MSRALDDLCPCFKPVVMELNGRSTEAGIPLIIIFTGRTPEQQADLYAQGRSRPGPIVTWTLDSKHVMRIGVKCPKCGADGKAKAIDVCPYDEFRLNGPDKLAWDTGHPAWQKIGAIGERLGLKWGVIQKGVRIDLGHFEMVA